MIRLDRDGPLAIVHLDRPERRNALTPAMLADLRVAIGQADDAGALVLLGEGTAFCAGFDLNLCRESPGGEVMRALLEGLAQCVGALRCAGPPVVVGVQGAAIAGGCALLAGADFVITHDEARLGYPVLRLGISPAVNAPAFRLAVGDGHAREKLLAPILFDGREAKRIGLAHESLADASGVRPRAIELARTLAGKPPEALRATKRWLNEISPAEPLAALRVSLALAGGEEERRMLPAAWSRGT